MTVGLLDQTYVYPKVKNICFFGTFTVRLSFPFMNQGSERLKVLFDVISNGSNKHITFLEGHNISNRSGDTNVGS